jgi:integrase
MAKFNFNLRNPQCQNTTPIQLIIRWNNNRLVRNTMISIHPQFWDVKQQKIKQTLKHPKHAEENRIILNFQTKCEELFIDFQKSNSRTPEHHEYKKLLDLEFNVGIHKKEIEISNLVEFAKSYINELRISENPKTGRKYASTTIRVYNQCIRILEKYQDKYKTKLIFEDVNMEFYRKFRTLMEEELSFNTNTVGKHISTIKLFMNEALGQGKTAYRGHLDKRFVKPIEKVDRVYLTDAELKAMYDLDLSAYPRLERVRDSFVFHATQTALRPIDWHQIKSSDISTTEGGDVLLRNVSQKSKIEIVAPIYGIGLEILKKYFGRTSNSLPPLISDQKANQYIKEVARMLPELNVEVNFKSNEKNLNEPKYKWQYVENRTARRSFATNLVKSGKLSTRSIMLITGHLTEDSFIKYLKLTTQENAELVSAFYRERENNI